MAAPAAAKVAARLLNPPGDSLIIRRTYALAGQTIAVEVSGDPDGHNGLFYVYGDHLGSASAMTDAAGAPVGNLTQYYPFGDYRAGSGANPVKCVRRGV